MFKSVLIIIFVIVLLWLIRTVTQRSKATAHRPHKPESKDTVQCLQCKTYIPREDAIFQNNQSFCSQQHLQDWNRSA